MAELSAFFFFIYNMSENFIAGIHNYCDRWCERCTFTTRCRVADAESEMTDRERDIENKEFWLKIAATFAEASEMFQDKAEEFGIEINSVSDEEYAEIQKREDEFIANQELTGLAHLYSKETTKLLEKQNEWLSFSAVEDFEKQHMLEIIQWYQYFIAAKVMRGFHGILDFDGNFSEEELNDPESDANGSIKIAIIAAERSKLAWTALLSAKNTSDIRPMISLLEKILKTAEKKFPNARDFVRPGFDEQEFVM